MNIAAIAIILGMGCRERTRGAIAVPGDRPAGVFSAGAAQRYVNIEGYMVGKKVLILGSGGTPVDIYTDVGTAETLGETVTLWLDPDGMFTYHIGPDGSILAVDIRSDGISATATAVQATP